MPVQETTGKNRKVSETRKFINPDIEGNLGSYHGSLVSKL
jgi:hypothetical protein